MPKTVETRSIRETCRLLGECTAAWVYMLIGRGVLKAVGERPKRVTLESIARHLESPLKRGMAGHLAGTGDPRRGERQTH